jgi:hypothetical protein
MRSRSRSTAATLFAAGGPRPVPPSTPSSEIASARSNFSTSSTLRLSIPRFVCSAERGVDFPAEAASIASASRSPLLEAGDGGRRCRRRVLRGEDLARLPVAPEAREVILHMSDPSGVDVLARPSIRRAGAERVEEGDAAGVGGGARSPTPAAALERRRPLLVDACLVSAVTSVLRVAISRRCRARGSGASRVQDLLDRACPRPGRSSARRRGSLARSSA